MSMCSPLISKTAEDDRINTWEIFLFCCERFQRGNTAHVLKRRNLSIAFQKQRCLLLISQELQRCYHVITSRTNSSHHSFVTICFKVQTNIPYDTYLFQGNVVIHIYAGCKAMQIIVQVNNRSSLSFDITKITNKYLCIIVASDSSRMLFAFCFCRSSVEQIALFSFSNSYNDPFFQFQSLRKTVLKNVLSVGYSSEE